MFFLGHTGIGLKVVQAVIRPKRLGQDWYYILIVLFGTLLPDLVDKPLYYGLSMVTGLRGADLGLVSGTRTFGHTLLLPVLALGFGYAKGLSWLLCIGFGMLSHLVLDHLGDLFFAIWTGYYESLEWRIRIDRSIRGLFWPFMGMKFPIADFNQMHEHFGSFRKLHIWLGELIGAGILYRQWIRIKPTILKLDSDGNTLPVYESDPRVARIRRFFRRE